jgi:excisionase family DNA binding protein
MPDFLSDELMTVADVAALLKLNQQTIRNWIDAGKLPHLRVGERRVRVYRSDLDRFLAGAATVVAEPPPSIWDGVVPAPVVPH